jgi:hypothetical protein
MAWLVQFTPVEYFRPPQRGYGGRLLLQRQLPYLPKCFFDAHAQGPANFGLSPETEFFNIG